MERKLDWPICRSRHRSLDALFQNQFFELGNETYGEDNTLIWQWHTISNGINERNAISDLKGLMKIESSSDTSLRDLYFQQAFLLWYLDLKTQDNEISIVQSLDTTPEHLTDIPDERWLRWPAKLTLGYDGQRVENFEDWLGVMD